MTKFYYKGFILFPKAWVDLDKFPKMKERIESSKNCAQILGGFTVKGK